MVIASFNLTAGTDTTIHENGAAYTFNNASLTNVFSDVVYHQVFCWFWSVRARVVISPKVDMVKMQ